VRRRRRRIAGDAVDRRLLFGVIVIIAFILLTNIGAPDPGNLAVTQAPAVEVEEQVSSDLFLPAEGPAFVSEELWADVTDTITTPRPTHTTPATISIDVRDANLIDLLSLLAYKLDVNIIYLGEPTKITLKTENLTPITTLQIVLQKEDLDYLVVGRNYIVGDRGRLYDNFANRMLLTRYSLFYVSAAAMQGYISELGVDVQSLTVDSNQQAIWMQGTPISLGKARELINSLDIMENAAFAEGGARKIRMPVATASGPRAEEELEALIDLLSILLDGFRDGRVEMGWVTWDHPDPVPSIFMEWDNPIIKPYDIVMKITRDFANDYNNQVRYLIAEGKPANIELVNQMIEAIAGTPYTPFSLPEIQNETETVQWVPSAPQSVYLPSYTVTLNVVPGEGGSVSGGGSYTQGSTVTVAASTNEGFEFVHWIENGYIVSTGKTYVFSIYADRNFEAVYRRDHSDKDEISDEQENISEHDSR
jgi:hypothetical protein